MEYVDSDEAPETARVPVGERLSDRSVLDPTHDYDNEAEEMERRRKRAEKRERKNFKLEVKKMQEEEEALFEQLNIQPPEFLQAMIMDG